MSNKCNRGNLICLPRENPYRKKWPRWVPDLLLSDNTLDLPKRSSNCAKERLGVSKPDLEQIIPYDTIQNNDWFLYSLFIVFFTPGGNKDIRWESLRKRFSSYTSRESLRRESALEQTLSSTLTDIEIIAHNTLRLNRSLLAGSVRFCFIDCIVKDTHVVSRGLC